MEWLIEKRGDKMAYYKSNEPYSRVEEEHGGWKGAAIGAGLAGLKMAAIDVPLEHGLMKKDWTKSKLGNEEFRVGMNDLQEQLREGLKEKGIVGFTNRASLGGGWYRAGRYGAAIGAGALVGGLIGKKDE
jgi:hypothetical protein